MILSGDIESKVHDFSKLLNVPVVNVKGICSPLDKLSQVRSLQKEGNKVLMIGDGFNDMPVLAGSDVSISFGKSIAVARSLSDLVIMGGKLQPIVDLIKLSRKTMKIIKINLIWAAAYNAICIPLAIFGLMPAWLAGLGMATSSLIVLLNSHRLIYLSVNN
jgi:Cu2+-exporting ATPase